jgi:hypothetical protein
LSTKHTVLGKRRALDEWQEGSALKKGKGDSEELTPSPQPISVFGSDDSEDERLVEKRLVHNEMDNAPSQALPVSVTLDDPFIVEASTSTASDSDSCETIARKRKRLFMDAVEVPTLREILNKERKVTPDKRVLRRTRLGTTRSFGPPYIQSSVYKNLEQSSRKPSKQRSSGGLFSGSPSRILEDMNIAGSGQYKYNVPTASLLTRLPQMIQLSGSKSRRPKHHSSCHPTMILTLVKSLLTTSSPLRFIVRKTLPAIHRVTTRTCRPVHRMGWPPVAKKG